MKSNPHTFRSINSRINKIICFIVLCSVTMVQSQTDPWTNLFLDWNSTQGNSGTGVIRSVRVDPINANTAIIGAATAGIWRTTNNGQDYSFVSGGVPEVEWVNQIIYSRSDAQVVYANTDVGVVKSIDGGFNWAYTGLRKTKPNKYGSLNWLDVPRNNSDIVYATTEESGTYSIHKSIDGAVTWSKMYQTNNKLWDMRIKPDDANTVYILEQTGNWINFKKSTNSATTFITIDDGYPSNISTNAHRARIATTPANNSVVYVAIGYNGGGTGDMISFFKSTNSGDSFIKNCCGDPSSPLGYSGGTTDFLSGTCHLAQITWNFAFTVSETDENFLVCAANKVKVSTDGGSTWNFDRSGQVVTGSQYDNYASNDAHRGVHGDHHGLSVSGDHIWNGNDGGVYLSKDRGVTVVKDVTEGLGIQEVWGFGQSFKNDIMAVGLNHNQICIRDDNVYGGWIGFNGADAMCANVNPIDDKYLYTHPWGDDRVTRSLVSKYGHVIKPLGISLGYITLDNLEFHPHQYYTIYGNDYNISNDGYKIVKTTDNATSWKVINDLTSEGTNAISIKVSFSDSNYVYAVVEPNRVLKSRDEGETWTDVSPPSSLIGSLQLGKIAVSDKDPDHIWVSMKSLSSSRKAILSTDGGVTWIDYSTGLPQQNIHSLIYQRGSDDILYLGTGLGIYYRKAGMSQWELFGTGMQACRTSFLHINYAKGKLRLGTSRGLWENNLLERTAPKANMTVDRVYYQEESPVIQYADYSVVDMDATFLWSFPEGTPATSTEERPTVTYNNADENSFDATLTVTDSRGSSTQTLTNFIQYKVPEPVPTVHYTDSEETTNEDGAAINAIDGNNGTYWHSEWSAGSNPLPHEIQIDLLEKKEISGLTYLARQDHVNGRIANYEVYVSNDPEDWGLPVATGTWANSTNLKTAVFPTKHGRYYRLVALSTVNGDQFTNAAEINIIEKSSEMSVYYVDSEETNSENAPASKAIDGNVNSFWHTEYGGGVDPLPHEVQILLPETVDIKGFTYLPRQDQSNGRIANYEIYVSTDPDNWGAAVAAGTWGNTPSLKTVNFTPKLGRFFRLVALSEVSGNQFVTAAEINVIQSTLGSHETEVIQTKIEAFPIPMQNKLNVQFDGDTNMLGRIVKVQLIDINGKVAFSQKIEYANNIEINTENISDGIYFLNVSNRGYNQTLKVVKGNVLLDKSGMTNCKQ
ncbi:MAG: photosystem II stability/assembly factor-like uncharacterized protein [Saprospiraceae bacterium]|jgi:photosystem II stability/assembly factor-like uncharacterized protein